MSHHTIPTGMNSRITAWKVDGIGWGSFFIWMGDPLFALRKGGALLNAITILLVLGTTSMLQAQQTAPTAPLNDVKEIQVLPTVINNPQKVKNPDAAAIVEKALRRAILVNELQVAESAPVKARISLDEFTGGSSAARFMIGFGAGRSTVDCRIQLLDQSDKEIASVRVRVRGDLTWSSYQGNTTQTKQAVNKFERALMDEFDKWKRVQTQKSS